MDKPTGFYFRHVDPERNRYRHYLLTIERDLLGQLVVVRRWGRIGAPGWHRIQVTFVHSLEEANEIVREVINRRRWHGYRIVADH